MNQPRRAVDKLQSFVGAGVRREVGCCPLLPCFRWTPAIVHGPVRGLITQDGLTN